MSRRLTVAAVAAVAAVALLAGAAQAASAATATSVTMFSDRGDYIGGGQQRLFEPGNASVSVGGTQSYLTVSVSGGTSGDSYTLDFAAPPGELLEPGVYDNAQRAPFRSSGRPGIDISGDGRGCNTDTGRFEVKDIATDSQGNVDRLWMVYEQHCEGGIAALFGEVRIAEPVAGAPATPDPALVRWPAADFDRPGTAVPVTLVASGVEDVSAVSVSGPDALDFPIRLDACTGKALAAGGSCQVWVAFAPSAPGTRTATLEVDGGGARRYETSLEGFTFGGVTRLLLHSQPGDWVGSGEDYSYTPANADIAVGGSPEHVGFSVQADSGDWWYGDFAPPSGNVLAAGDDYGGATRYPFNNGGAGLSVYGNGNGCNTVTGSFHVAQATYGVDDEPTTFAATFEQHCDGASAALTGEIDFRAGDTTPPAPWVASGSPPPAGGAAGGTVGLASGTAQVPAGHGCTRGGTFAISIRRRRGVTLRRVDVYIGARRVAVVTGSALRRPVELHAPSHAFRLRLVVHALRGTRPVTLRSSRRYGPCARRE